MAVMPSERRCASTGSEAMPGVGAAQLLGHVRVQLGHAAHVRLVDEGLVRQMSRALLAAPIERGIDHRRERRERRAVPLIERQVAVGVAQLVGEQLVRPLQGPADRLRVGIEQKLRGIEAQPGVRIVRSVHAIAVELAGLDVGQIQVPDPVRSLADPHAGLVLARRIEQAQLDRFRAFGEQREIDAAPVKGRALSGRANLRTAAPVRVARTAGSLRLLGAVDDCARLIKAASGIHGGHRVFSCREPDGRRGVLLSAPGTWPCRTTPQRGPGAASRC